VDAPRLVNVFISYAHEDRAWCNRLRDQLGALVNLGQIRLFDDGEIRPGERWDARIRQELSSADIIVLIVSDKFLASKYSTTVELRHAVEGQGANPICVIPVVADHVDLGALPFGDLQLFPVDANRDLRPLVDWKDESSKALAEIASYVRRETERIRGAALPVAGRRTGDAPPTARSLPFWIPASTALLLAAVAVYWSLWGPAGTPPAGSPSVTPESAGRATAPPPAATPSAQETVPPANPKPVSKEPRPNAPRTGAQPSQPIEDIRANDVKPAPSVSEPPREIAPATQVPTPEEARRQLFVRADAVVQCVRKARNDGLTMQVLKILRTSATSLTTSGLLADLDNAWPARATEDQQRAIAETVNCVTR
jgi:hypothetical protein